jgi:hypothetical protein
MGCELRGNCDAARRRRGSAAATKHVTSKEARLRKRPYLTQAHRSTLHPFERDDALARSYRQHERPLITGVTAVTGSTCGQFGDLRMVPLA